MRTENTLSCTLSTPEFRKRKSEILDALKAQVLERTELPDGYQYAFPATDIMLDALNEFIKTERACCTFFTFQLTVLPGNQLHLQLTGPAGTKHFIETEINW